MVKINLHPNMHLWPTKKTYLISFVNRKRSTFITLALLCRTKHPTREQWEENILQFFLPFAKKIQWLAARIVWMQRTAPCCGHIHRCFRVNLKAFCLGLIWQMKERKIKLAAVSFFKFFFFKESLTMNLVISVFKPIFFSIL